ncbi:MULTISPECIES: hypothetical protein, partial [Trichocoleus]
EAKQFRTASLPTLLAIASYKQFKYYPIHLNMLCIGLHYFLGVWAIAPLWQPCNCLCIWVIAFLVVG